MSLIGMLDRHCHLSRVGAEGDRLQLRFIVDVDYVRENKM